MIIRLLGNTKQNNKENRIDNINNQEKSQNLIEMTSVIGTNNDNLYISIYNETNRIYEDLIQNCKNNFLFFYN